MVAFPDEGCPVGVSWKVERKINVTIWRIGNNGHGEPSDLVITVSKMLWELEKGGSHIKGGILVSVAYRSRSTNRHTHIFTGFSISQPSGLEDTTRCILYKSRSVGKGGNRD